MLILPAILTLLAGPSVDSPPAPAVSDNSVRTLAGTVLAAPSGIPLGGIPLKHSCQLGVAQTVFTDSSGHFHVPAAALLVCQLQVDVPGFVAQTLDIQPGDAGPLSVRLEIQQFRQSVTVEAFVSDTRSANEVSQTVTARTLSELPSNGRNVNRAAFLNPQVRNVNGLGADGSAGSRVSINAASFRGTYYVLDGGSNWEFSNANAPLQKTSVSAIGEFKVLTNQFSAEYGRTSAGIIASSTKAGSDSFHGEALFFARPSGIQARPVAASSHTPNQLLQYGASAGGPLVKSKTHFFLNYEQLHQQRGAFIQSPAPSVCTGRFADRLALVRLDHAFTSTHSASLRANFNRDSNDNPSDRVSGFVQPSAAQRNATQAAGAQLTDRFILSPSLVNELRASYVNAMPSYTAALHPSVSVVRPNYSTEGGSTYTFYKTQGYELADSLSKRTGSHTVRMGGDYHRQAVREFNNTPYGEYRFAPGAPKPGEQPLQYTQTFGTAIIRQGSSNASGWIQDDWRAGRHFTANLGLRYEWQSITRGDRNNWAPRAGIAFDPDGSGRTVIRAAAGLFYDAWYLYLSRRFFLMGVDAPTSSITLPYGAPGFPAYPQSLTEPPGGLAPARRDFYIDGAERLNPYTLQYTLTVEQRLGSDWLLTADAIHSHSLRQWRVRDVNAPAPFPRSQHGQVRTVAAADLTRPYAAWQGVPARVVSQIENSSRSRYDALALRASRRFAGRYQLEAHYLYSSAMTYGMFFGEPNTGIPADWGNPDSIERGPSDFHQRHRLVAHGVAEFGWASRLSFVFTVASGLPLNPLTGIDNNGDTYQLDRPVSLGRNSFRTPAHSSLDLSFTKSFAVAERSRLEFRADAFNLANRSNLIRPNAIYGDRLDPLASFLRPVAGIANSEPARQFQFGLRLLF